jgi:SAM-dependent methyltransferase
MTQLSFADKSLDFVLSFDVMEHIPDYRAALAEKMRCLKPGGKLLFTAPFIQGEVATQVRARLIASGEIEHILPPEYHVNPTKPKKGCLCFYDFGWDILDDLKQAGASDASIVYCYSAQNAYWGEEQMFFLAVR